MKTLFHTSTIPLRYLVVYTSYRFDGMGLYSVFGEWVVGWGGCGGKLFFWVLWAGLGWGAFMGCSGASGCRPDTWVGRSSALGGCSDTWVERSGASGCRPDTWVERSGTSGCRPDTWVERSGASGCRPDTWVKRSGASGCRPDT
ncbi:hypothetical protein [Pontibacillus sp. HN14]|nr:hypothetical protein [Pontibacillus sp. HN14]MCD5325886.1 hypothetical protein [Pontibacillus sp. HN14]